VETWVRRVLVLVVGLLCVAPPPLAGVVLDVACQPGYSVAVSVYVAGTKVQVARLGLGV